MRKTPILSIIAVLLITSAVSAAPAKRGLLDELQLPVYTGAKVVTEIVLPSGPLLDKISDEYGDLFGLSNLRQVNVATYSIDQDIDTQEIFRFYDAYITAPKWTAVVRTMDRPGNATSIVFNEKTGMLIMNVDALGKRNRQLSIVRLLATIDVSKIASQDRLSQILQKFPRPGIPVGAPLAVPPSEKLNLRATQSDVTARFAVGSTVEVHADANSAGEVSRTEDGRLLLELTPKLPVDEIILPANVPNLLELTKGSLTLTGGKPSLLNVIATSAPVTFEAFPLVSGTHSIKEVGGNVDVTLSSTQGGVLDVEVQGGNLTLALPKNASASIDASAPSGKIQNLTGASPKSSSADSMSLQVGAGRSSISLKAVNGTITIKLAD